MALYAIGDLHLSLGCPEKDMAVFGGRWVDYIEKIRDGFSALTEEDVCVLCGDISWGMSLEGALEDLRFLNDLPGKKVLLKGNHDYWWETGTKMRAFTAKHGLDKVTFLHNSFVEWEGLALCGTRGWFYEEEKSTAHDGKVMRREIGRLEMSLRSAGEREKLVFLHYPPLFQSYTCPEILALLKEHEVKLCCYGHIHANGCYAAFRGERDGTEFRLVSADYLNFRPVKIRERAVAF